MSAQLRDKLGTELQRRSSIAFRFRRVVYDRSNSRPYNPISLFSFYGATLAVRMDMAPLPLDQLGQKKPVRLCVLSNHPITTSPMTGRIAKWFLGWSGFHIVVWYDSTMYQLSRYFERTVSWKKVQSKNWCVHYKKNNRGRPCER